MDVAIHDKYALSVEEAAAYFNIGQGKLRELIHENECADWLLWNRTRATIKRVKFEKYLDSRNTI